MMAPVLVPAKKSNSSRRTRLGLSRAMRNFVSMASRILREKTPRIPPPSRVRMRFGGGGKMKVGLASVVARGASAGVDIGWNAARSGEFSHWH